MNSIKTLTIGLLMLIACAQRPKFIDDTVTFDRFPKEQKLKFENFYAFTNGTVRKLYLKDTSLVLWNAPTSNANFFYNYSLPKMELINGYLKQGREKGASLGPLSGGVYDHTMWIYDVVKRKVITSDLRQAPSAGNVYEYEAPQYYFSTQLQDSLKLFVAGSEDSPFKIQVVDLKTGKEIDGFGSYNDTPAGVPFPVWKKAHQSSLFMSPNGKKAVLACRITDQIEVFDLQKRTSKTVKGPEKFKAEFTAYKSNGRDMMERNEKTRFAFINGHTTKQHIYLLYSGQGDGTPFGNFGKFIVVYDWNGNPIIKFNLDKYIASFAVSDDETTMYAFDGERNYIMRAKFKL